MTDSQQIALTCTECRHQFQQSLAWLKGHRRLTCPACGAVTDYDGEQFGGTVTDVQQAVKKIGDALSKRGKFR